MAKRLNPMKVHRALSYETEDLARALSVTCATIRNMVKRGMPVMASRKPYLYSGEAVREFIVAENKNKKSPMAADQLRCMTCRTGRRPLKMTVDLQPLNAKTGLLTGICERCGGTCTRMISLSLLSEFAAIFDITERAGSDA